MTKRSAFGTLFAVDMAGGTNYVTVAQVENISGPALKRNTIDATTHDSPDAWMEFIKGLKDGGDVTLDLLLDPELGSHSYATGLLSDFSDDTTIPNGRVTFPNGTVWSFPFILAEFPPEMPIDDSLKASVSLKVAGKPTLA